MQNRPVVLSIAGYDPSSGAGVTADVKTAAAMGCYAVTCITALTVQSTQGVFSVDPVRPELVRETLDRLAEDVDLAGIRIGMLGSRAVGEVVADFLKKRYENVVLDPVLRSSSGARLVDDEGIALIRSELLPLVDVVTPNVGEAAILAEQDAPTLRDSWLEASAVIQSMARRLHELGCWGVVITGGHLEQADDFLSIRGGGCFAFSGNRIETRATHGTGCAFATALTCLLARGRELPQAVGEAKEFVRRAMLAAYPVGKGTGPLNHLFRVDAESEQ